MINSALPNAQTNPDQAELYDAFANKDVQKIIRTRRDQRKQIFITNMVTRFTTDIAGAQFEEIDFSSQGDAYGQMQPQENKRELAESLAQQRELALLYGDDSMLDETETFSGFLVTLTGYCPYGKTETDVYEILDPSNVANRKDKWGFVTRLQYIDQISDVNVPFELYDKANTDNYFLDVLEVDTEEDYPVGTGIPEKKIYPSSVGGFNSFTQDSDIPLIDPLTKETISKTYEIDEDGRTIEKVNDHWFILKMKFLWKKAPKPLE